jgi:hypothetical protein
MPKEEEVHQTVLLVNKQGAQTQEQGEMVMELDHK